MSILIAAAVFCAWVYFWVRGALWAAIMVPMIWVVLLWLTYTDGGAQANTATIYEVALLTSLLSFAPYLYHQHRKRQIERTLHGVSFFSRLD